MILYICELKDFAEANSNKQKEIWSKNIKTFWIYQNPPWNIFFCLDVKYKQTDKHSHITVILQ